MAFIVNHGNVIWVPWHLKTPATQLMFQQLDLTNIKGNIKAPYHWPCERWIHRSPMDSPRKRPVQRRAFPCHDVVTCAQVRISYIDVYNSDTVTNLVTLITEETIGCSRSSTSPLDQTFCSHVINTLLLSFVRLLCKRDGTLLSGEPDYFGRNKISSGGDLSHYSSASLC